MDHKKLFKTSLFLGTWFLFFLCPYLLSYGHDSHIYSYNSEDQGSSYHIKTKNCIIPAFHLDHPSIAKYRKRVSIPKTLICSKTKPLTEVSGLNLLFYKERLRSYKSSLETVKCYYQGIQRVEEDPKKYSKDCDRKYKLKEKVLFKSAETKINEDAVVVKCEDSKKKKVIYKDVHYFIQPSKVQKKMEKFKDEMASEGKRPEKLNVIIMGTDSVSRDNLQRHMPKTFKYLKENLSAIDLQGFNKIGDNTNPNVVAMLMDLAYTDLEKMHRPKAWKKLKFDDYPFLWKNFSENGYVTIFGEDSPRIGTFNYERVGFVKEPTDYYTRPYFQASESIIGHKGNGRNTMAHPCQGTKWSMKIIHKLSLDMAEAMKDVPYFGLYWTSSITHDFLDLAALADQPSVDYLEKLLKGGHLENTVLFFLSDHGMRFGEIRKTYPGYIEERMPYVMIRLPDWFKEQYPDAYNNMRINAKRLTSTFDLYVTLRDILRRDYANLNESATPARYGQSLFHTVPLSRSCPDAGIPDKYCACQHTKEADPKDVHLNRAAEVAVAVLNEGLQSFPGCAFLSLEKAKAKWRLS
ncbi:uncharacterized protein [Palaemon carinicauda]|uniref:uncharacterized protein isoform X2 n=1 Tax=Palaemon carinicauda TaxID=392227 RepID=UPI0035B60781